MKDFATQGLRGVQGSVEDVQTQTRQLVLALEEALKAQQKLYADNKGKGISTDADVKAIQALKAQIDGLKAGLEDLDKTKRQTSATPVVDEQVARSASNLKMQFQQVARELPSLAMGPQMFILAISNNLPMLADAIKNVREENERLSLSGQKGKPVWKQLAGALLSWQTALTVGITLLITYGDEIVKWIGNLFKGKDALNAAAIEQARLNKAMGDARKSAASQTAQMSLLYKMTQNSNASLRDRKAAVAELQRQYPAYFGNLSAEAILAGNAAGQYRQLANDILKAAYARAYQKRIEKLAERNVDLQRAINADQNWINRNRRRVEEQRRRGDVAARIGMSGAATSAEAAAAAGAAQVSRQTGASAEMDRRTEALKRNTAELKANEQTISSRTKQVLKNQSALLKINRGSDYVPTKPGKGGGNHFGGGNNMVDTDSRAKAAADAEAKAAELIAEQRRKAYEEASEQGVEAMTNGTEKEVAAVRQEGEKKRAAIDEDARKTAEALAQAAYRQYLARNPKKGTWKSWKQTKLGGMTSTDWTNAVTNPSADTSAFSGNDAMSSLLSQARQVYADRTTQQTQDEELKVAQVREKALKDMLGKYEDFEAQRQRITKEGNDDIAKLEKMRTTENSDRIDRAIAEAKERMRKAIQDVNDSEAAETAKDSPFLKSLFGDTSEMGFSALQKLIGQARELRKYLSGTGSREEAIKIIPADELARIEKSPAELDKLKKALDRLLKTDGEDKWAKRIKDMRKALDDLADAKDFKSVAAAIGSIGSIAADSAKDIADMFEAAGNNSMADAMNTVSDVLGAVSNIGQGFAKGGIVGGIAAAVGEAANFIGKAFAANARHKAALKEIMNEQIAQQRAYNLLLLEQNLLYKEAATIFGTDTYAKAANAVNVMKDAYEQLNEAIKGSSGQQWKFSWKDTENSAFNNILNRSYSQLKDAYSGLADISIVTGHKKTGLFGWGKGKDVYSSILDVYPQLIDASGKFD